MSLTVWSFALLHGFFVLIVAGLTHSKTAVAFAAIVAAVAGLLVGDPVYIALDLLCVAVATYYCWADLAKRHQRTPQEIAAAQEKIRLEQRKAEEAAAKRKKTITDFLQGALMLGAAVFVLYSKFWQPTVAQKNTANATIQQQQQQQQQQTVPKPVHAAVTPQKNERVDSKKQSGNSQRIVKKTTPVTTPTVANCLGIPNEQAMVRCLESAQ